MDINYGSIVEIFYTRAKYPEPFSNFFLVCLFVVGSSTQALLLLLLYTVFKYKFFPVNKIFLETEVSLSGYTVHFTDRLVWNAIEIDRIG